MGFALLFVLSALAAFAALAAAVRARLPGRAELLIAATMIWNAIIVAPIYALGLTNRLWPRPLAVGSVLTSVAALALASRGVGFAALARETGRAFASLLRLPGEALALSARPFRFVFVGVAFSAFLLPYLALSAYLGQQLVKWDPLWYHDPIVGFTIQNHGFAMVDLPDTLQKINGYVRLCEMTQLWLVIFTDRRLADLANVLFAPAIAAAGYVLARRHTSKVLAMGWGVSLLLVPACAMYLHTTYVDPQNAAIVLAAVVFATASRPRLADGLLAGLCLALSIGSKGLALISVPIIGLVGAVSLLREHWTTRRRAAIGVVAAGAALTVATASATYLRNYLHFHNPFWPDLRVNIPALGIHWPGQSPWTGEGGGGTPLNLNESLPKLLDHLYALPWSVKGMWFDQAVEYGIGVVWIAVPIGVFGFLAVFAVALRRRLGHYLGGEGAPPIGLALILGVMVAGSPALWGPRYHVAHVGLLFAVVAWFTSRPAWQRLAEPAVSAIIVTSLMMFWWTPAPSYYTSLARLVELAHAPALERELSRDVGAPTTLQVGLAREKELTAGKLLVFDENYSSFPSVFWNNTFSNRVKYVRGGAGFLTRAAQAGATWISLSPQDPVIHQARAAGSGWQEVGLLNAYGPGYAFRRVEPPAPAPKPAATPPAPKTAGTPPAPKPAAAPPAAKPPDHPLPAPKVRP